MLVILSFYLTYASMVSFALATDRHHKQVFSASPGIARARALRLSGVALGLAAVAAWVWRVGLDMGLVSWLLWVLPLAGVLVVVGFAFRPQLTARIALRS